MLFVNAIDSINMIDDSETEYFYVSFEISKKDFQRQWQDKSFDFIQTDDGSIVPKSKVICWSEAVLS